jgi:hypothetical protein
LLLEDLDLEQITCLDAEVLFLLGLGFDFMRGIARSLGLSGYRVMKANDEAYLALERYHSAY